MHTISIGCEGSQVRGDSCLGRKGNKELNMYIHSYLYVHQHGQAFAEGSLKSEIVTPELRGMLGITVY